MDIEQRLAVLERRTRWLAVLAIGLGSALALGAASGSVPKEVRARSFVLEGPDGRMLAVWRYAPDKRPGDGTAMLTFYGQDGKPHAGITCDDDGAAGMGVYGPDKDAAIFFVMPDGAPQIEVKDTAGKTIFTRP